MKILGFLSRGKKRKRPEQMKHFQLMKGIRKLSLVVAIPFLPSGQKSPNICTHHGYHGFVLHPLWIRFCIQRQGFWDIRPTPLSPRYVSKMVLLNADQNILRLSSDTCTGKGQ